LVGIECFAGGMLLVVLIEMKMEDSWFIRYV
jgi:hypothetical protein